MTGRFQAANALERLASHVRSLSRSKSESSANVVLVGRERKTTDGQTVYREIAVRSHGFSTEELDRLSVVWVRYAGNLGLLRNDDLPGGGAFHWLCERLPPTSKRNGIARWELDDPIGELVRRLEEDAEALRIRLPEWKSPELLLEHARELQQRYETGSIREDETPTVFERDAVSDLWAGMRHLRIAEMPEDLSDRFTTMADVRRSVDAAVRCLDERVPPSTGQSEEPLPPSPGRLQDIAAEESVDESTPLVHADHNPSLPEHQCSPPESPSKHDDPPMTRWITNDEFAAVLRGKLGKQKLAKNDVSTWKRKLGAIKEHKGLRFKLTEDSILDNAIDAPADWLPAKPTG